MSTTKEEKISAPTTPGQAEGSENLDEQSETSPAPSQLDPAEGEVADEDKTQSDN